MLFARSQCQPMKLPLIFNEHEYLANRFEIFTESLPSPRIKNLTVQILDELFLRPYLPSREICNEFDIDKKDLKSIYSSIRSSKEARELFEFSPYHYLVTVLEHLSRDGERTLRIIHGGTPYPLSETMELFISETCNAKCEFCYRNGKIYDEKKALSTRQFVNLINEFADLHGENLDVSGGLEPLLSTSINDVLKAGLDRNLKVSLYTNGIALNNSDIINCLLKISRVRVSLNAYDKESYKKVMGVDKFETVIANIRDLVKAKKDTDSKVKIGTSFVVFEENCKHIPEAIKIAQELDIDSFDLRSVEVTDFGDFDEKQRNELRSILKQIRQNNLSGAYGNLRVSVADTFNAIVDPSDDPSRYLKKHFVNALSYFRVTVTPQGKIYALNLIGQPSREDARYLLGEINGHKGLSEVLRNRKAIPFEPKSLLSHDITLMTALSKLESDLEFGISLEENPFNWK